MAFVVYVLCLATALLCSGLLARGYVQTRHRLLFWASICFLFLGIENAVIIVDLYVVPDIDIRPLPQSVPLIGVCTLLYGLLWESK